MRTVIPSYLKWNCGMVSPCYDTVEFKPLAFMLMASFELSYFTLTIMPEFTPNKILLDRHADKADEPWQIYAWAVRDIMSKKSGLRCEANNNLQDKLAYIDFMTSNTDYMEVKGRLFMINGTYDVGTFQKLNHC